MTHSVNIPVIFYTKISRAYLSYMIYIIAIPVYIDLL